MVGSVQLHYGIDATAYEFRYYCNCSLLSYSFPVVDIAVDHIILIKKIRS